MKRLFLQVALVAAMVLPCQAEATWDEVEKQILALAPEPEWTVVKERDTLTLIRKNCRLSNNISAPMMFRTDPELTREQWEKHGWDSDFKITIRREPELSDARYAELFRMRSVITQSLAEEAGIDMKIGKSMVVVHEQVEALVRLPDFRHGQRSIFFDSTDHGHVYVEPESVEQVRDKVREVLKKNCQTYPKQEP